MSSLHHESKIRPDLLAAIARATVVEETSTREGPHTRVIVNQVLFPRPGRGGEAEFAMTSLGHVRLSPARFDSYMAQQINATDSVDGRKIFAVHLPTSEVVAAVSYHIPIKTSEFVLVTALAPRVDTEFMRQAGRACIPILKATIHEISSRTQHDRRLGLWASGPSAAEAKQIYGFRPGRRPRSARAGGREFLVQD